MITGYLANYKGLRSVCWQLKDDKIDYAVLFEEKTEIFVKLRNHAFVKMIGVSPPYNTIGSEHFLLHIVHSAFLTSNCIEIFDIA